jgi:cytochrome oxidase Cu insertion factor (SCO1/SenC/PrrC family)
MTALALLVLAGCSPGPPAFAGTAIDPPIPAEDFALPDHRGGTFRLDGAEGKVVVLTFLYTSCLDVCPLVGIKLREAYELLGEDAARVDWVAVSSDPERDTQERAADYSRALGMFDRWHYLVGTTAELRPVWEAYLVGEPVVTEEAHGVPSEEELRSLGLYRGLDQASIAEALRVRDRFGGGYDVGHGTPVWLIDGDHRIRVKLGADLDPADLAHDVRLLLDEGA